MAKLKLSTTDKAEILAALSDLTFVNEKDVDKYKCELCRDVANVHFSGLCGHRFCRKCYDRCADNACPIRNCTNTSMNKATHVHDFDQGLFNLQVYCVNKGNGCDEIISLDDILAHKSKCKFSKNNLLPSAGTSSTQVVDINAKGTSLQGTLQCNCQSVEKNMRDEIEKLQIRFEEKLNEVKEDSLKVVHETQRSLQVFRRQMHGQLLRSQGSVDEKYRKTENDIQESPKLEQKLETVRRETSEAIKYLENNYIRMCAEINVPPFKDDVEISPQPFHNSKIQALDANVRNMFHQLMKEKSPEFTWTIKGITAKLQGLKTKKVEVLKSDYLKAKGSGIEMKAQILYLHNSKSIAVFSAIYRTLSDNARRNQRLDPREFHQEQFRLLDQSDNYIKKNIWRNVDSTFGNSPHGDEYYSYPEIPLKHLENSSRYVRDDSIKIRIRLVPYSLRYKSFYSDNGILFWKLDNFQQRKQDTLDGVCYDIQSEEFYTMERGYRMQILVVFKETHVAFHQFCIVGEHDSSLSNTFPHEIQIVIFDQSDSQEKLHLKKTAASNLADFSQIFQFTYQEIQNSRYLKNDCLMMKISVTHTN